MPLKVLRGKAELLLPHLVFGILVLETLLLPDSVKVAGSGPFLAVVCLIETVCFVKRKSQSARDILSLLYLLLILWESATAKFCSSPNNLFPSPQDVFAVYAGDSSMILAGIGSSLGLLALGFAWSLSLGIVLGILVGWNVRVREVLLPVVKVITPIPPLIYTPYAIALLPSFRAASTFIVFCAVFWGMFLRMIHSVAYMDRRMLDSILVMDVDPAALYFQILFPYCLPSVFSGLSMSLSAAFMVLISAEMIGGQVGVGWYVKYNTDFGNYTKVVAGIILVGILVTAINTGIKKARAAALPWRNE